MAQEPSRIRTVAIAGQGGVGKTSVADALAFVAGANNRLGRVEDGSSLFDVEPEEIARHCSITSSILTLGWDKNQITVIDTPGQGNFVNDTRSALRGASALVFVVDASAALRAESVKVWEWAKEEGLPALIFVNKLDKAETDLDGLLASLHDQLGLRAVQVQVPIGAGEGFVGVVDVFSGKAHIYDGESGEYASSEASGAAAAAAEEIRATLMEDAAEGDDELLESYLEKGELGVDDMRKGLRAGITARTYAPVLLGAASQCIGVAELLDAVAELLPSPAERHTEQATDVHGEAVEIAPDPSAPFTGFVFKTIVDPHAGQLSVFRVLSGTVNSTTNVHNTVTRGKERLGHILQLQGAKTKEVDSATVGEIVAVAKLKGTHRGQTLADASVDDVVRPFAEFSPVISFAIEAKKRGEEDKAMQGLNKLTEEDAALRVERDETTGEILLSGAGQLHVEVACEKLTRKYGVEVVLKAPKVPYRETIRKAVKAHGRLKKQSGGHGQFADCHIEVEPLVRGGGFEFVDKIVGGTIPRGFIPAVEKGVREAMKQGTLAGFPVVDVRVTLYDGQYHDVDSSEMAFKVAGSMAFREALEQGHAVLLEPIVSMGITSPDDCMGDVMGDLNARRGKVEGMERVGLNEVIKAKVPMSEVLRYAPDLTSLTSGRGAFEMGFSHYEPVPDHLVAKLVESSGKAKEG